jgi:hypothetical protein
MSIKTAAKYKVNIHWSPAMWVSSVMTEIAHAGTAKTILQINASMSPKLENGCYRNPVQPRMVAKSLGRRSRPVMRDAIDNSQAVNAFKGLIKNAKALH